MVLEARERLGGRIAPGQVAGLDVDFGGMWLSPTPRCSSAWAVTEPRRTLCEAACTRSPSSSADAWERSVTLGAPVRSVVQGDEGVVLQTDRGEVEARDAIFTTPPGLTEKIDFEPSLDDRTTGLLSRQKMGSCIKVWIAYERPFWREQGSNALFLSDRDDFTPISDATPPGTHLGVLAGFFDAEPARRWTGRNPEERRAEVLETLASGLGDEALHPVDYVEKDWCEDPWSEGCYGAYMRPGTMTEFGPALRAPHGRIHWAGTETATVWSSYIEGAVRSGERAATEVLERLRG